MENQNKEIGRRIKEVRKGLGITQGELGQALGVAKAAVSKYEAGDLKRGVPVSALQKIAEMGNVPLDYLTAGDSTNSPPTSQSPPPESDRGCRPLPCAVESDIDSRPLKLLTRQEEEVICWLRGMPPDLRDIAAEGVRSVWIMASRRNETKKHSA
jgi:transcriptional regulator with XRE-family HTH domain